jgi:hypothetical protein
MPAIMSAEKAGVWRKPRSFENQLCRAAEAHPDWRTAAACRQQGRRSRRRSVMRRPIARPPMGCTGLRFPPMADIRIREVRRA